MHRTQVLLEDRQYERLKQESTRTGHSIGALIRDVIAEKYEEEPKQGFLHDLKMSHGAATEEDFDGLSGEEYVEMIRRRWSYRM